MAEAFISRQDRLEERLKELTNKQIGGLTATIAELQEVLHETEACHELYKEFDDGALAPEIEERREQRRLAGLSIDPAPSQIKCRAWSHLKVARQYLAVAYYEAGAIESCVPLYHLLVQQTLRMRTEIWEEDSVAHHMMNRLSCCYNNIGQFNKARIVCIRMARHIFST